MENVLRPPFMAKTRSLLKGFAKQTIPDEDKREEDSFMSDLVFDGW